ncbi:MAG: protein kinase family protein [Actinomycetota bacterium]|nr:protein kinase family protein [Actinomycetota bacterium]
MLAGRYRLEERIRISPDGSLWHAVDETLQRTVTVRILRPGHPFMAEVVRAARRAALVDDPRLVRVLDVGQEGLATYIVAERLPGRTLTELLANGPLPAETARRLVGESAQALRKAAQEGLHHRRLSPHCLQVALDGSVRLSGTAIDAASEGLQDAASSTSSDDLARDDAVGLVHLLYAALTGRWAGAGEVPLPTAPRIAGAPVRPGDLVSGIPHDLDALCTSTLGPGGQGPSAPGELVEQLQPWAATEPLTDPGGLNVSPSRPVASAAPTALSVSPHSGHQKPRDAASGYTGTGHAGGSYQNVGRQDVGYQGTGQPEPGHQNPQHGAGPWGVPDQGQQPDYPTQNMSGQDYPTQQGAPTQGFPPQGLTPQGYGPLGFPDPGYAPQRYPEDQTAYYGQSQQPGPWSNWPVGRPVLGEERPAPFAPAGSGGQQPKEQSRLVLMVMGGFLLVVLFVAVYSLISQNDHKSILGPPQTSSSPQTSVDQGETAEPTGKTPSIQGIVAIDPFGEDGNENNDLATNAIDSNPETKWRSSYYTSADYGRLKDGVGLVIHMDKVGPVRQVVIDIPGEGGVVELRTTRGTSLDDSTVVATAPISGGQATLKPKKAVSSQDLVLWFTRLPQTGGEYRLFVSEIRVQ